MTSLLVNPITIILGYTFIGGTLKYIDQVYDRGIFDKRFAYLLSILAGIAGGVLIGLDQPFSLTFFAGMIAGLIVTKKIDAPPFVIGTVLTFGIPIIMFFSGVSIVLDLLALIIFAATSFSDEVFDHLAETGRIRGIFGRIFLMRPWMWVGAIALFFAGKFMLHHLIGFAGFTVAYLAVEKYSFMVYGSTKQIEQIPVKG